MGVPWVFWREAKGGREFRVGGTEEGGGGIGG